MNADEITKEVAKLSLSEKLTLVEDIWDSIATENSELPMPEWQKVELDKRYNEYESGKLNLHDWKNVHEALKQKS